ncbi:hypothetical protein [Chlamydia sp. 17-3921]|uniref:hypothetical protein n=1 Tax=Chlamydia sp. 17-3921 TaxID=2675798 RepID=UPI00191A20AE|nr:hypothetical protein [Chlamydia sp. 17-3921]
MLIEPPLKKTVEQLLQEYQKLSNTGDTAWKVARYRVLIHATFVVLGLGLAIFATLFGVGVLTGLPSWGICTLAIGAASLLSIGITAIILHNKELSREFSWRSNMLKWKFLSSELQMALKRKTPA